jgi:hypothetical protein
MTEPETMPTALRAWAERNAGSVHSVRDASHPRPNSRVWELTRPDDVRFFVKVSPSVKFFQRETFAYWHAVPALGSGGAAAGGRLRRPPGPAGDGRGRPPCLVARPGPC